MCSLWAEGLLRTHRCSWEQQKLNVKKTTAARFREPSDLLLTQSGSSPSQSCFCFSSMRELWRPRTSGGELMLPSPEGSGPTRCRQVKLSHFPPPVCRGPHLRSVCALQWSAMTALSCGMMLKTSCSFQELHQSRLAVQGPLRSRGVVLVMLTQTQDPLVAKARCSLCPTNPRRPSR